MNVSDGKFDLDAGYYEYEPGLWFCGKFSMEQAFGRITRKSVNAAKNVKLQNTDIMVTSYPKSGQTWLLTILNHIVQKDILAQMDGVILPKFSGEIAFLEMEFPDRDTGTDRLNNQNGQRIIKTHLPQHLLEDAISMQSGIKVIHIIRNPKDTLVSYYHHLRNDATMGQFNGTWDDFFQLVKERRLCWGDIFEETAAWYGYHMSNQNSLVLRYEEMKKDLHGHVIKIARFIGRELDYKDIDLVTERSSFPTMKHDFGKILPFCKYWKGVTPFIRKGEVGDWVNYFTEEQSLYIEEQSKTYFEPLGLSFNQYY